MKRKNLMMKKLSAVIISATMLFSGGHYSGSFCRADRFVCK